MSLAIRRRGRYVSSAAAGEEQGFVLGQAIGEPAVPEQLDTIHAALGRTTGVERVIHLRTVHQGRP